MANNSISQPRILHKLIETAYDSIHSWLDDIPDIQDYRKKKYEEEILPLLKEKIFMSAATQFHTFFHAHYFKVVHTFDELIGRDTLVGWLNFNPRICIVDIGCGAGAGSAAVIEMILKLQEESCIPNHINVFCIGIDPNPYAVVIYDQFMRRVKEQPGLCSISLEHDAKPEGIPNVTSWLIDKLEEKRDEWEQPQLAHMLVMQVNVVSPLSDIHHERQENYDILRKYGSTVSVLSNGHDKFGVEEARAYKSILENVAVDHMHVITIGTDGYMLNKHVREMGEAIEQVFSGYRHKTETIASGEHTTRYINPKESYWGRNTTPYPSNPFHVNAISITNQEFRGDKDWHEVISEENLKLAWGRVRYNLLRDSFFDEVEIRIFEENLDENLAEMRQQLMAYADEATHTDDCVVYKVPKNITNARVRGLSRMEEELLSVAIIQKLGKKESQLRGSSYAYRINQEGRDTEYLYKSWFFAYRDFINDARKEAKEHPNGAVISVDIRSFYTRIIQDSLIELLPERLNTKSQRIHWLIKLLLSKNLDEHEVGRGIVQGSLSSGFYANVYLTSVDARFGTENEWGVKLFRFVDDMLLVIPEPTDDKDIKQVVKEVYQALEDELKKEELKLEINEDKKEIYYDVSEFLQKTEPDTQLEQISEHFEQVTNVLWVLDDDQRQNFINWFDNDELWWFNLEQYRHCLQLLEIYIDTPTLSRRIFSYLFSPRKRRKHLRKAEELSFQKIPQSEKIEDFQNWSISFTKQNGDWIKERNLLHIEVSNLLDESWEEYKALDHASVDPRHVKKIETRIRFALKKLCLIGFTGVSEVVIEILQEQPWITRDPRLIIESLSIQGFSPELIELFTHYKEYSHSMNDYLRAIILRVIRFLPSLEDEHWAILIDHAITSSTIERLMATESWAYLNDHSTFVTQQVHIPEIERILQTEDSLSGRLVKNYELLLKLYNQRNISSISIRKDSNYPSSYKIDSVEDVSEIFDKPEPKLIREEFYSGRHKDDKDYGEVSPG